MNKTKFEKAVYYFVLVSMLISIIYVIYRIIAAPSISNDGDVRTKSTYTLMLLQCIVGADWKYCVYCYGRKMIDIHSLIF